MINLTLYAYRENLFNQKLFQLIYINAGLYKKKYQIKNVQFLHFISLSYLEYYITNVPV